MSTATDIITECNELLGDDSQSTFTQAKMLTWLNRGIKVIVGRSRSIQRTMYAAKVASQFEYPLPDDFLQVEIAMYSDGQFYRLKRGRLAEIHSLRYSVRDGNPGFYDVWGNSHAIRTSGTVTGGSTTTLVDSANDFTLAPNVVRIGDKILNTTDDSEGTVTEVTNATTITASGAFSGGTDNTPTSGDSYQILNASAARHTLVLDKGPSAADTTGSESIKVLYAAKHRVITQTNIGQFNQDLELDFEFEEALIQHILYRAYRFVEDLDQAEYSRQLFESEYRPAASRVKRRVKEFQNRWARTESFTTSRVNASATRTFPYWYGNY